LACALEGNADFIISGDKHLLNLRNYQGIKMVTPGEFLESLQ
jgi:predicted nucleic acid-binding protein